MALRGLIFYTVNEVSEIMQVRVETVLRWIYAKKIKASKLPGSRIWRIREEDIVDFMERGANTRSEFKEQQLEEEIDGVLLDLGYEEEVKKTSKAKSNKPKSHLGKYEANFEDNSKKRLTPHIKVNEEKLFNEGTSIAPNNKLSVKKSDVIKMKDGNYVTADKLKVETDKVVDEFVFDEEQAKKPIEEDIALVMINEKDIHICDDQEENLKEIERNDLEKSLLF